MRSELPPTRIDSPALHRALAHPVRHRLLMSLRAEPATTSQLARLLDVRKGSIAHHLGVLVEAGLVCRAESRQVRGGTEEYYRVAVGAIVTEGDDVQSTTSMFTAMGQEFARDPDALVRLRHLRLSAAQAERLRAALAAIVADEDHADDDEPAYGVLVGLYRRPADPTP